MLLAFWILLFACSLFVLIKSSDYFIISAEEIGLSLNIPSFIMGVTIIALGTSLPELITSTFAVLDDTTEIVVGNVVGSNASNILLIIGISLLLSRRFVVPFGKLKFDYLILLFSAGILSYFIWIDGFNRIAGIIFTSLMVLYLAYVILYHKEGVSEEERAKRPKLNVGILLLFLASGFFIAAAAKFTVKSIQEIAALMNTGEEIISLTILALGTSLPELFVSLAAVKREHSEMILGNILGSNIFNTFAVMGIPSLMSDLSIPPNMTVFSLPVMILATVILFILSAFGWTRSLAGMFLLLIYLAFVLGIFFEFSLY
jgi:cation:H+ antiporter